MIRLYPRPSSRPRYHVPKKGGETPASCLLGVRLTPHAKPRSPPGSERSSYELERAGEFLH
jgi:hypothetical protein